MTPSALLRSAASHYRRHQRPIACGCAGLVVLGVVAAGLALTPPPVRPQLLAGDIWLASRAVGQMTLVNGASAQVSAAVGVADPNTDFDTEQAGRDGYAVDTATGNVVDVRDATLEKTATTLSDGTTTVLAGTSTLFAVDPVQHAVQLLRPETFAPIGRSMALPSTDPVLAEDGRQLWAADGPAGMLVRYDVEDGTPVRHVLHLFNAENSQPRLVIADGQPVLIDPTGRVAMLLASSGHVTRTLQLNLRHEDVVSGSADTEQFNVVQPDHGLLTVCDFGTRACRASVPLTGLNHDLGAAVQTGGHVFVPDYTSDVVDIVDLGNTMPVEHTLPLSTRPIHFELVQRDGIVYVNDPDSAQAAVVEPDGQLRRIDKYDPQHPSGVAGTTGPHPSRSGPPVPKRIPEPTGSGHPLQGPAAGDAAAGGTSPATTPPNAPGPHIVDIVADPTTPEAEQSVGFSAQVTGSPTTWSWLITTPRGGTEAAASTPTFSHVFTAAGDYLVRLTIRGGTTRDSQSIELTVLPFSPPVHCGETLTTSVVLTTNLDCTGTALTIGAPDLTVDLGSHTVTGAGGQGAVADLRYPDLTVEHGTIRGGLTVDPSFAKVDQVTVDTALLTGRNITVENSTVTKVHFDSTNGSLINTTVGSGGATVGGGSAFVTDCRFIDGGGLGFQGSGGGFAVVTNNTFVGGGLGFTQSDEEMVSGNTFTGSGIILKESASAVIENNRITGAPSGIIVGDISTTNDVITGNTFTDDTFGVQVLEDDLGFFAGTRITGNNFTDDDAAGIDIEANTSTTSANVTISKNTFTSDGHRPGGAVDPHGHPVEDGVHIDVPAASDLLISDNNTRDDAAYGIYAQPGTVQDGGGNTSRGDPRGCLGVQCG